MIKRIGVLTSGGDAQGMNAAVRAVTRTALDAGLEVFAIHEGLQGMVEGGELIHRLTWNDVGGILHQGGTLIGSARSADFRTRAGRLKATKNLVINGIEGLVVIGGDGSLTGANLLHEEWSGLLAELVAQDDISAEVAAAVPALLIVGLVGSIDNDMYGTDMTIGADSALNRIVEAVDAITSTAASHQRSFVVEVMGRHCGYLALMGALASGADWVLIPESPPDVEEWEETMCELLRKGREMGRRDSMVIVAEGAHDRNGKPITCTYVRQVLEERLGEDTRITVLGHVQRGGRPSAFDRNLSTITGYDAVHALLEMEPNATPLVIGLRGNQVTRTPLKECLEKTWAVAEAVKSGNFTRAMDLRGRSFEESFAILRTIVRAWPHEAKPGQRRMRIAVIHSGGPAPGMNTAVRAVVRLGIDRGHHMFGVYHGFRGLAQGEIEELDWMSVNGWAPIGGADLGTNRVIPSGSDFYAIARNLEEHQIDAILMIGGYTGYQSVMEMHRLRHTFPSFNIPIVCIPASINNNLPGAELAIGADTALNNIMEAVDKIKQSAVASQRTFVVEVMGNTCGYLALLSGLATGAEKVYMHEDGVTIEDLVADVKNLIEGFSQGKRLGLMIRNELANPIYTTEFMHALFEEEGGDLFDVRQAILGHLQQGGSPSPFDRILAIRFASHCIKYLEDQVGQTEPVSAVIGLVRGELTFTDLQDVPRMLDEKNDRPRNQWWLELRDVFNLLSQPGPQGKAEPQPPLKNHIG